MCPWNIWICLPETGLRWLRLIIQNFWHHYERALSKLMYWNFEFYLSHFSAMSFKQKLSLLSIFMISFNAIANKSCLCWHKLGNRRPQLRLHLVVVVDQRISTRNSKWIDWYNRVSQCWKSQKVPPATEFSRFMYIAIYKKAIFFENFNGLRLPLRVSNICSAVCSYEYRASTEVTEIE